MKALVVYYSLTGKTKLVAEAIAQNLNTDIRRVEDLRKRSVLGRLSGVISAIRNMKSEIKPADFDIHNYDLVFIGTPVWAFKPTPAINTFILKADFKNKKVVLFITMGGIGGKNTIKVMRNAIETKGGKIINSFAIRTGGVKDEQIIEKGNEIGRQYKNLKRICRICWQATLN